MSLKSEHGYHIRKPECNEKCNGSRWGLDRVVMDGWTVHRMRETGVAWRRRTFSTQGDLKTC